jgi:predicted MFS family arabinose efflux permease
LTLLSWIIFGLWPSLAGLVVGVVILDFAVQSALISNQSVIYALQPEARARINTVFMTTMFVGGAVGSAAAAQAWERGGWSGLSMLGAGFGALATMLQLFGVKNREARGAAAR